MTKTDGINSLKNLSTGILTLSIEKEVKDLAYKAMDRQSKDHAFISRKWEYSKELARVIEEVKLTNNLLKATSAEITLSSETYNAEDLILYYEGVFLDQVHQSKDKLFQLIKLILTSDTPTNPRKEKDIDVSKFLQKNAEILKKIGIYDLLETWKQDSQSGIGVVLRKRTQHHHRISGLGYDTDLQKAKMMRTIFTQEGQKYLSDYGKTKLPEIAEESYRKWRDSVVTKQDNSIKEIETNIYNISDKLIIYFKLPTDVSRLALSVNAMMDSEKALEIVNQTSIKNIHPEVRKILDETLEHLKKIVSEIDSVYLIGSAAREDFIPGVSDANLVIITKRKIPINVNFPIPIVDIQILSKQEFWGSNNLKARFTCYSDGLLVLGELQKFDKKEFPKPGTLLALLLNKEFENDLEEIREKVSSLNPTTEKIAICAYSKKMARIMINFIYGVAIGNEPSYTSKMTEKIEFIKTAFPSYISMINLLEQIYLKHCLDKDSFPVLIDNFYIIAKRNYEKMLQIQAEISK